MPAYSYGILARGVNVDLKENTVSFRSNTLVISLMLAMALLSVCVRAIAQPGAYDETLETLIGRFWHAQTEEERSLVAETLLAKNPEARSVFRALAAAKLHTSDVATGVVRASRTSESGL